MLCVAAGIDAAPLTEQHAAYIAHWRATITNDQRLVTTAAQRAQRATDRILETTPQATSAEHAV